MALLRGLLRALGPGGRGGAVCLVAPRAPALATSAPALLLPRLLRRTLGAARPRFGLGLVMGGGSVVIFMYSIRAYKDSLVMDFNQSVHPDGSKVSIGCASRQVPPTVQIVSGADRALVDRESYSGFVQASVAALLAAQEEMEREASRVLGEQLDSCFSSIHPRAEHFADWYFSYSTSFRLLQEATVSLARHTASFLEQTPVNEAVAADMDRFMTRKYERIVLRPEMNNPALQAAYLNTVRDIHNRYLVAVAGIESGMAELVASETSHLEPPGPADIRLELDWASQLHKIKSVPANFEKSPELTLLLSTAGAAVGKSLASKGVALGSAKAMAGKLTAPFVTKVVAAGGGAAVGSLAGPLGTAGGVILGLGLDYTVNAGIELVKREEFIKDVGQVVAATRQDYFTILEQELHRATRVWIDDAIQLVPRLGPGGHQALQEEGNGFGLTSWLVSAAGGFCWWPARF